MDTLDLSLQEKHTIKVMIGPLIHDILHELHYSNIPSLIIVPYHRPPSSAFRAFPIEFRGRWTKVKMAVFLSLWWVGGGIKP